MAPKSLTVSAKAQYRQTCSDHDHERPEHGWLYDPNGWELV